MTRSLLTFLLVVMFAATAAAQSDVISIRREAESGDPKAQDLLGTRYRTGIDGPKDFESALKWYRAAARQGFAQSMFNIGTMFYNGDGVASDLKEAYAWFLVGSLAGDNLATEAVKRTAEEASTSQVDGILRAVEMLQQGKGIPRDEAKALTLLKLAADIGDPSAETRYALRLIRGEGLPQDLNAAKNYCLRAADQGYTAGMTCLAYIFEGPEGLGDCKEALKWYRKAANVGNPVALYGLGQLYADGCGVKVDNLEAAFYLRDAATTLVTAQPALTKVESRLSEKQKQKLAKTPPQHYVGVNAKIRTQEITDFPLVVHVK